MVPCELCSEPQVARGLCRKHYSAQYDRARHEAHPLRHACYGMQGRCRNPGDKDWHNYGARGITVYEPWIGNFPAYERYVQDEVGNCQHGYCGGCPQRCAIDRVDKDGPYEPGQLRWATPGEQWANRRDFVPFGGKRARGERQGSAKLTEASVRDIRRRVAAGESKASVARRYDVTDVLVGMIVRRRAWGWLE
jgi:hypothetical protein